MGTLSKAMTHYSGFKTNIHQLKQKQLEFQHPFVVAGKEREISGVKWKLNITFRVAGKEREISGVKWKFNQNSSRSILGW